MNLTREKSASWTEFQSKLRRDKSVSLGQTVGGKMLVVADIS